MIKVIILLDLSIKVFFYQYIKNLQNDIIAIADGNGTILVKDVYDAYGNILSITDTSGIDLGNINPFRFKSYYYDTETGFYYLNSRYYDALVGRFINADDIRLIMAGEINLFWYCKNNPIMNSDISGNASTKFIGFGIQIEVGLGLLATGIEIVWYTSSQVNVNGRNRLIPYVYIWGR